LNTNLYSAQGCVRIGGAA